MPQTTHNYINGEWVCAPNAMPNINPSDTSDIIGEYGRGDAAMANDAAEAAYLALPAWADATPQMRAEALENIGLEIMSRKDEIGRMLSREEGKPLAEGIGETIRAAQIFKFYAQEALRVSGDAIASVRAGVDIEVTREPVGVVGLITPWNFPIAIPAWKIAPALAYGNTVVFKPADLTPACAHMLSDIIDRAGVPAGVFNLVMGPGASVGEAITTHAKVAAISFTGSTTIGRSLADKAVADLKKVQLEMGGKNPMVVMNDADLTLAVDACLNGAFFSTGQKCTASSRLIVEAGVYDAFVERLDIAMKALKIGHALAEDTQIGPVVSQRQLQSNLDYVALAKAEGAETIGGEQLTCETDGYYQAPALFVGADNQMRIAREEIFGPCATIIKVADFEEAVSVANDTEFGLSSGICTSSQKYARAFKRRSEAGMVMTNLPTAGVDYHVPFGGRKNSSYGSREQGTYAKEFYTAPKTTYIASF
ncbi:MAG: aldehyde dehydrogenase family protein [Pseudomonadota bacterium]